MTDNEIVTIDIKKYAEALNNLIGVDSAYLKGDNDVDAIVEIITLAKKMENTINRQKAEIERLEIAFEKQMSTSKHWKNRFDELTEENDWLNDTIITTKAEAITEFAERVKAEMNKSKYDLVVSDYAKACNDVVDYWVLGVDQIAKEMKGEQ